ncbi:phytanoyl-CoA dioxygenase family protein [Terasakiella sp. A23]|uniref:phytanoyl-CoA dioxygenase family protein n=1 Tax=Terasakiella sp. FCG-A23 TaxID=3080561 RepID=UPI002954D7ED|nr:phytanoyl-CoA dioxygenase family protein [Terasakiella sp. A23]MDV7339970.1 phytanoyl-CoA dioxygenase family protein [Terasakiella sp. A23]
MTDLTDKLQDVSYWRTLNPHLSISEVPTFSPPLDLSERFDAISDTLHHDGYLHQSPLLPEKDIKALRTGIENLVAEGWPAAFIYVYDDVWNLFHQLNGFLSHFLGDDFGLLPHFWAWHIDKDEGGATSGWPPHVDYPGECAFFDDFLVSLSLWIPLTDATPENGCMNILPLSRQKEYDPPIVEPTDILLQDVRCLPAKAGSLLGWRQDLWHWSGRSSRYAADPRMSLSLEFQNRAFDPLCPPLFDLTNPPEPLERVRMICAQFAKYDHMERVSPELEAAGKEFATAQA